MPKITRPFFEGNKVLFMGYSSKEEKFCRDIVQAMSDHGFDVYPLNHGKEKKFDIKVYRDFNELPSVPENVYIYMKKENAREALKQLKGKGVKKVLFQSKRAVDHDILEQCREMGAETAVACAMMLYGKGFHRFHGFLSGVR